MALDVAFEAAAPWTILFGPSGSGKSTILRAIAGLAEPHEGRILVRNQLLLDTSKRFSLPAHSRPVRWAAQTATLFPRMTVAENLAFTQVPGSLVQQALEHFRLAVLAQKHPAQLSGGERQRVSVVRAAIAARGKLLLLDEPFTGLDAVVRGQLIADLRTWLVGTPVLSVTHNVSEAFLLGAQFDAEVIRLADGRILTQGPPATVLAAEREGLLTLLG